MRVAWPDEFTLCRRTIAKRPSELGSELLPFAWGNGAVGRLGGRGGRECPRVGGLMSHNVFYMLINAPRPVFTSSAGLYVGFGFGAPKRPGNVASIALLSTLKLQSGCRASDQPLFALLICDKPWTGLELARHSCGITHRISEQTEEGTVPSGHWGRSVFGSAPWHNWATWGKVGTRNALENLRAFSGLSVPASFDH